jgi:hypothetical protein
MFKTGLEKRFKEVVARRQFAINGVESGRRYVAAYVELMHSAEAIHSCGRSFKRARPTRG